MADPTNATTIPHLIGITLDSNGVSNSQVVAINRTTGERLIKSTDNNKKVIFDVANFTSGYSASDVIEFSNVGASRGGATITINTATGGFQNTTITCSAASTAQRVI